METNNTAISGTRQKKPLRLQAEERRKQILYCAKNAFAQYGYHDASTGLLAHSCGISEPVLYRHFVSKKQLFLEAFHHYGQHFVQQWFTQTQHAFAQQPRQALARLFLSYRQFAQEDVALQQLVVLAFAEMHDPDMAQAVGTYQRTLFSLLTHLFEQAQEAEVLAHRLSPTLAAWNALSILNTMLLTQMLKGTSEPLSLTDAQLLALGDQNLSEEASSTS